VIRIDIRWSVRWSDYNAMFRVQFAQPIIPSLLIRVISRSISEIVQNLSFLIAFVLASYVWPILLFSSQTRYGDMMWREDLLLLAHRVVQSHCHLVSAYCYNDIAVSLFLFVASHISETRLIAVSVHNLALKRAMMFLRLFPFSCTRWVLSYTANRFRF